MHKDVEIAIIGSGSAGLYAMPMVRKSRKEFVVINGGAYGTTCARVGCMPSKALIQVANDYHRRTFFDRAGIYGSERLTVDIPAVLRHVRSLRDGFVGKVVANTVEKMPEYFINAYARFEEPDLLRLDNGDSIRAKKFIIATGGHPIVPEAWRRFGDRVLTTDSLFEQEDLPPTMAVLGLGVIGLEMGQALSRLGIHVVGVDMLETVGGLHDPEINRVALELIGTEFPLWLGQPAEIEEQPDGRLRVNSGERSLVVDKVLAALGRAPNLQNLGLDKLGVKFNARGLPDYDPETMQIGDLPVFIAGDVNGARPTLHEAADEGRIAGFNATHENVTRFKRKPWLGITFCDPNIAAVGASWKELAQRDDVAVGGFDFSMQSRAKVIGENHGLMHLYGHKGDGRLLGAEMIVPGGENLAHQLAWAVQHGMTVFDLLKLPFYHPVLEEGLQSALYSLRHNLEHGEEKIPELDELP